MFIKKANGKIFGAKLTNAEQKALDIEIRRQFAEFDREHTLEVDALILWQLMVQLGFGPERLKRFYENFAPAFDEMIAHYELNDSDGIWYCQNKLKERGIDLEEWERERRQHEQS